MTLQDLKRVLRALEYSKEKEYKVFYALENNPKRLRRNMKNRLRKNVRQLLPKSKGLA